MAVGMYEIISRKRDGGELSRADIEAVIAGYVRGDIPDYQMSALLMAVYIRGLADRELADLTEVMMLSGERLPLSGVPAPRIDKHSTGGVGDKVSFVLAPLVASCGVRVPMLSGRGLGHTGGTLDKLEAIPGLNVFLTPERFAAVLNETGMAICGQTENIVPADRKIYALRDASATVSSLPLIASSIMSKKLALGTDGIVLDVKTGSGAFMRALDDSIALCRTMVAIGAGVGRPTEGLITQMDRPLGRAVGNALEMVESFECLKGNGPADVMEVTYALGARMLLMAGAVKTQSDAMALLRRQIESGAALETFRRFVRAQGGDDRVADDYGRFAQSRHRLELPAWETGAIERIDAFEVGMSAIDVGAGRRRKEDGVDHATGFLFHRNAGDPVRRGEPVVTVLANDEAAARGVGERLRQAITIGPGPGAPPPMVLFRVDTAGVHPWPGGA